MNGRLSPMGTAVLTLALTGATGSCLPHPPPKARIKIEIRGAATETVNEAGYRIAFERRVNTVRARTNKTEVYSGDSSTSVRNLDVPPFELTEQRTVGERFFEVSLANYSFSASVNPGVTETDVRALAGEALEGKGFPGHGVVMQGTVEKDGVTLPFDFAIGGDSGVICGAEGARGLGPLVFESDVDYTITVIIHLEKAFASASSPLRSSAPEALTKADADHDGVLSALEAQASFGFVEPTQVFEVSVGGVPLRCRSPGNPMRGLGSVPDGAGED